jgi:hypothetical protein
MTRDELIASFSETHTVEDITFLADRMIGWSPDWANRYDEKYPQPFSVEQTHAFITYYKFLNPVTDKGWIDPDGKFWACEYWAHDKLLDILGVEHDEADMCGWVRISNGCECTSRMTPNQVRTLRKVAPWAYSWMKSHWAEEIGKPAPLTKEQYIEYFGAEG